MKHLLQVAGAVLLLLTPSNVYARDGFWASNKLTIGYDQVYTAIQVDVFQFEPPRTRLEIGYIFEVYDNLDIVPRYRIQIPQGPRDLEHIFGLDLKLTFP